MNIAPAFRRRIDGETPRQRLGYSRGASCILGSFFESLAQTRRGGPSVVRIKFFDFSSSLHNSRP
jgi:hypothetical protein